MSPPTPPPTMPTLGCDDVAMCCMANSGYLCFAVSMASDLHAPSQKMARSERSNCRFRVPHGMSLGVEGSCVGPAAVASGVTPAPEVPRAELNANRLRGLKDAAQKSGLFAVGTAVSLPAIANSRVFSAQTTSRHASAPRRYVMVADQGIVKTP